MTPRRRVLSLAIYGLAAANLLALWLARGDFVPGWDLFGATFGVLALNEAPSFSAAVGRVTRAFLAQAGRPVFTGGESYLYGLVPGVLNGLRPWLLWGHLVCLVLLIAIGLWLCRRLRCRHEILWACIIASPAFTSQAIVGLPHLTSTAIPFGLAIGWVLSEARRGRPAAAGVLLDALLFAAITFVAFNGYESGKTFFVVPVIAALTLSGVPLARRLAWLGCAGAAAWLASTQRPMTVDAALASIPHAPGAFAKGLWRIPRRYLIDWYIDFPALLAAAVIALFLMRRNRLFWLGVFLASLGLVSLSAFQYEGRFLSPHRFLLLIFVCALVVTVALSERSVGGGAAVAVVLLLAVGIGYTTWLTARFVVEPRSDEVADGNLHPVYPLPYNHSSYENHIWRYRIRDAMTLVDAVKRSDEQHILLYGFSIAAEDGVNPQLFVSRVLLPLGWRRFSERVRFFDHSSHMFFTFPIHPLHELPEALGRAPTPFYLHVREPEYSADAIVAKYLNRARVAPVDLGLRGFRSFRVESWEPPGPIPVRALRPRVAAQFDAERVGLADGFCLTTWRQEFAAYSPLVHWFGPLSVQLDNVLQQAASKPLNSRSFIDVSQRRVPAIREAFSDVVVAEAVGYLENASGAPVRATLSVAADDEVAVLVNDQPIVESLGPKPMQRYEAEIILPPGAVELRLAYHKFRGPGGVTFASTDADGQPMAWRCPADFH